MLCVKRSLATRYNFEGMPSNRHLLPALLAPNLQPGCASDSQVWPCRVLIPATALAGLFPPFDTGLQEAPGLGSACMWEKRLPRRPCMVVSSKMRDGSVGNSTTANPENLKSVPGTHMGVSRELTPQLSSDFNTCPVACKHSTHTQTLRHPVKTELHAAPQIQHGSGDVNKTVLLGWMLVVHTFNPSI